MRELILCPTKRNLQKGVAYGLGAIGLAIYLYQLGGDIEFTLIAVGSFVAGLWMVVKSGLQLSNPKPVFSADASGFSVKGKAKRPWSEFRGVSVYRVRSGLLNRSRPRRCGRVLYINNTPPLGHLRHPCVMQDLWRPLSRIWG